MPLLFGIKTPLSTLNIDLPPGLPVEPVPREKLHITLLYVGDWKVRGEVLQEIERILLNFRKFSIRVDLSNLDFFPSLSKPRALVVKIEDTVNVLQRLRNSILNVLTKFSVRIEDRFLHEFSPHITIARVRQKLDYTSCIEILEYLRDTLRGKYTIVVDRIELIDSSQDLYKIVHTWYLQ